MLVLFYLEYIWFKLFVYENIVTEYFKAGASFVMIGETSAIIVLENCMGRKQDFDDYIVNVRPEFFDVITVISQPFINRRYSPNRKLIHF